MAKGFDCATPLDAPVANMFKRDGYEFVCRYLVPSGWKRLTKYEADVIKAAGLNIVSVWETTGDRALGGYDAGYEDGQKAVECTVSVGQPEGSTIYTAVDFEPTVEQLEVVLNYVRGFSAATPNHLTGVYGCYAVIEAAVAASVCSHFWQTYAWSHGQKSEYAQIYQYQNDIQVNGIGVDLDESFGSEGWWGQEPVTATPAPAPAPEPTPEPTYPLSVEDANYMIDRWLKHEYDLANDGDEQKRHDLANALRRASGQQEE